jgi:integrase
MASTRKRGKFHSARWRSWDGQPLEKGGFLTKKDAQLFANEQEVMERKRKNTRPSDLNYTLYQFVVDVWRQTLDIEDDTKDGYSWSLNKHILPIFGDMKMVDIKPADIEAWQVLMKSIGPNGKKGLADKTIEGHMNLLAAILKKAVQNGYLHQSPFTHLKRKKAKSRKPVTPLDPKLVQKIAAGFSERFCLIVWICFYTGMRPSEALGLTHDRLDFNKGTITIDRQLSRSRNKVFADKLKTSSSNRVIAFAPQLQAHIKDHVDKFGLGPHGLLMQNRSGNVWRYRDARDMFSKVSRPLGLQVGEGLHILRHTCVSLLIQQGVNPKTIQGHVGHESIEETMDTYGHLFPNSLTDLAQNLDNFSAMFESETEQGVKTA